MACDEHSVATALFSARFDDLVTRRAWEFEGATEALVAARPDDVEPVLAAVEKAAAAGWWAVGFVSYDAASGLDPALRLHAPTPDEPLADMPLVWFGLFRERSEVPCVAAGPDDTYRTTPWQPDVDEAQYAAKVAEVRRAIAAGETYQCNLTIRLSSHVEGEVFDLYRALALAQRGAYNAFVDTGRHVVASASPELFFSWVGDELTTRPMKGTAPRGRFTSEDATRANALLTSAKDRAENVMIVDLLRNDLGKLATWGGVEAPSLFDLERYATVWQLTSTVTAHLRDETTLVEIFKGLFPCGSVTGAPKTRTMALIAEVEDSRRSLYCGAIGVVAPPGEDFTARFNVAIRTVLVDRATRRASYGTGGAIIWDSVAVNEHAEAMTKAAILVRQSPTFDLLETMAFDPGAGIRNRARHLARLSDSASYFDYRCDLVAIEHALDVAVASCDTACRVRLLLSRSGAVDLQLSTLPEPSTSPVQLAVATEAIDTSTPLCFHKTTERTRYEAAAAAHPDEDDVVLVNEHGEVTETTVANLAVLLDGAWCTPPLSSGCLPGIERARLLAEGGLCERRIELAELVTADELAIVSSLRGWRAALLCEQARASALAGWRT